MFAPKEHTLSAAKKHWGSSFQNARDTDSSSIILAIIQTIRKPYLRYATYFINFPRSGGALPAAMKRTVLKVRSRNTKDLQILAY